MRRALALITILLLALPLTAQAETLTGTFPAERREVHGPVPAVILVATIAVPDHLVGVECAVSFVSVNNTSEHNTDLLVESDGDVLQFFDIERGTDIHRTGAITVGSKVEVYLQLNEHNARGFAVSSLGGTVTLDCQPVTTTTEPPPSTTITTPPSTVPTTSSTTTTTPDTTSTSLPAATTTTVGTPTTATAPPVTSPPSTPPDTPPATTPPVLPETGVGSAVMGLAASAMLGTGWLSLRAAKRDDLP